MVNVAVNYNKAVAIVFFRQIASMDCIRWAFKYAHTQSTHGSLQLTYTGCSDTYIGRPSGRANSHNNQIPLTEMAKSTLSALKCHISYFWLLVARHFLLTLRFSPWAFFLVCTVLLFCFANVCSIFSVLFANDLSAIVFHYNAILWNRLNFHDSFSNTANSFNGLNMDSTFRFISNDRRHIRKQCNSKNDNNNNNITSTLDDCPFDEQSECMILLISNTE